MSALRKTRLSVRLASLSLIFWVNSSTLMGSVPKKTLSSRVTATNSASSLSASCMSVGLLTLAISTGTPCCNMGVTTMKMMSSTSITSTIGVTLMSEVTFAASFRFANDMEFRLLRALAVADAKLAGGVPDVPARLDGRTPVPPSLSNSWVQPSALGPAHAPALQEVIDQFARGVIHLHVERFHATGQIVEHHNRRNRHEQSDCGGHKRLGNTARDRCQAGCLFLGDSVEGVQNADPRSEQSHEGSRRTDRLQTAQATLQFGVHDGFGPLEGALGSFNGLARNFTRAILVGLEFHQARSDHLGQMTFLVALGDFDRFVNLAFAHRSGNRGSERAGLIAGGVESHPTVNHHADRPTRHDEQNDNHDLRQKTHLLPERNRVPTDRALVKEPGGEKMEITECDCCQIHYHELLSSSELFRARILDRSLILL